MSRLYGRDSRLCSNHGTLKYLFSFNRILHVVGRRELIFEFYNFGIFQLGMSVIIEH